MLQRICSVVFSLFYSFLTVPEEFPFVQVNEVTKVLFQHATSAEEMSKLDPTFVQGIIQPVGLAPKKSQYIVNMSQELVARFEGAIPSTYEELESLPGVGHKTASVIMSQVFGVPSFAVDTHVHRLAQRWGISKEAKNVNKVQKDLCEFFPQDAWNKLHLQMIYFGREYCTAKDHTPSQCPICGSLSSIPSDSSGNGSSSTSGGHAEKSEELVETSMNLALSPKKRVKNLVYYSAREEELRGQPDLVHISPCKATSPAPATPVTMDKVTTSTTVVDEVKEVLEFSRKKRSRRG